MRLILSAVSLSLLAASPLAATDLRTTHREVAVPTNRESRCVVRPTS